MHLYSFATSQEEFLFLLVTVMFWVVVVGGLGAAIHARARAHKSRTPEEALFQGFTAGKIDDDEYRHRLEALRAAVGS
ncbi:hypothetical protein [Planotetraspora kaengkrachanensis]|uniref:SHOCT domain-containing protein n=1 Tax=Planotetraspora kaengkrachanensis TaxID=575193 RepID=A0A8J3PR30_9ACTN|nr:hypothetical protein [Planotetraspora kaengkrachanensis]GIG77538.1 hypothetical protein Pka01_06650 [Planotetraspora kaengkrachanensis]